MRPARSFVRMPPVPTTEPGIDDGRDNGTERIVITKGELSHRYRVILVDHRYRAKGKEPPQGVPRVEVGLSVSKVPTREEDLANGDVMPSKRLGVDLREGRLPSRRAGLERRDVIGSRVQPEVPETGCHSA